MNPFTPRTNEDPWFRVGTIAVTTTVFICGSAIISMFVLAAAPRSLDFMVFYPSLVRQGHLWRLATYIFPNAASLSAVLSIVMVFIFGREIESSLGKIRYLWFVGIITILPAIVMTATGLFPTDRLGMTGAVGLFYLDLGLFVAFVASFPTARGFFGIPLWVIGAVFVGIQVLQLIGVRDWDSLVFLLVVLATALLLARSFGLSEIEQIPKIPLPAFITKDPYQKANRRREKSQRQARKQRGPATVTPIHPGSVDHDELIRQAEIDALLDKISATGLDSLTSDERKRLEAHSKRGRKGR